MKIFKILSILTVTSALSLSINNFTSAKESATFNVAIVDVQKVVESSPQISALKTEERNKLNELGAFVEKAKADVSQQTDATKKKDLEEHYYKELNSKKADLDKEYFKKLSEIDKSITATIKAKAKAANYDLVLVKSSVLDGGTDITSDIIKSLK